MKVFKTIASLQSYIQEQKENALSISIAPTMGALHEGHMTLIKASKRIADITICTIFVNPTQFNEQSDFDNYPITIEADKALLELNDTDVLFLPSANEMYPEGLDTKVNIDLEGMDNVMEGAHRPGHFEGVMEVIKRFLDIIEPNFLVMGQKDFQQFSIIQKMIDVLQLKTKLHIVPIKRRKSGLAMSSRNQRLSKEQIITATTINKSLKYAKRKLRIGDDIENVKAYVMKKLSAAGFRPEYVSIADTRTLEEITSMNNHKLVVISLAAWLGDVRLIDNVTV